MSEFARPNWRKAVETSMKFGSCLADPGALLSIFAGSKTTSQTVETQPMKITKRISTRLLIGIVVAILAFRILSVWEKHHFCQGWSNEYAKWATQLRSEAANPALARDEAKECLIAAEFDDLISRKYAAVAWCPWRPYPSHPLLTPDEQQMAAAKH